MNRTWRRRREGGIALLLALLILTILIVLIAQMSVTAAQNKAISQNYLFDLQNSYGARSGYNEALLYLQTDAEKGGSVDTLHAKWTQPLSIPLGRAAITVTVEDSERKININQIQKDDHSTNETIVAILKRLVALLGHEPEIALRIIDYIRADSKGDFVANARHARLYNLEELLRIDGIPREALYGGEVSGQKRKGILDFVTLWPKSSGSDGPAPPTPPAPVGQININTAPLEVLQSLSNKMTETLARAIVEYRNTPNSDGTWQDFKSVEDLKKVSGMTDEVYSDLANLKMLGVKSATFEIRSRSAVGNVSRAWIYVVQRSTGDKAAFKLLGSQRLNDFLSVKPPPEEKP